LFSFLDFFQFGNLKFISSHTHDNPECLTNSSQLLVFLGASEMSSVFYGRIQVFAGFSVSAEHLAVGAQYARIRLKPIENFSLFGRQLGSAYILENFLQERWSPIILGHVSSPPGHMSC
jgi:hypothetical protein